MILVLPSIELINGDCCSCIKGEIGTENYYKSLMHNPLELLMLWRRENSKSIHLIDHDSFTSFDNLININSVMYLSQSIDIPIQLHSNINNTEVAQLYLDNGIYRVILSEMLFQKPNEVEELIKLYTSSRIIFGFTGQDYQIYSSNYDKKFSLEEVVNKIKSIGGIRLIYSDLTWGNSVKDLDKISNLAIKYKIRITIKDCVNNVEELWNLNNYERKGIDSVILGQSLYQNNFACQKIWRLIEAKIDTK